MKKIEAIIRPFKLPDVRAALSEVNITGMTISEVKGLGSQQGHIEIYRGNESRVDFIPKTKIEIVVPDIMADDVIQTIMDSARTGKIGDGKIFVSDVQRIYRIRTGESDEEATRNDS